MMSSLWYNSYIMKLTPNGEHMGLNTKTMKVKNSKPDYKNSRTPQERHMENVERGYTMSYSTAAAAARYEVIDGKRYKVVTL